MNTRTRSTALAVGVLGAALASVLSFQVAVAQAVIAPTFTRAQAAAGEATYAQACALCHGPNLNDGQFAPPVAGVEFRQAWFGRTADVLFDKLEKMPPAAPGSLGNQRNIELMAFLLSRNDLNPSNDTPLPGDVTRLQAILLPGTPGGMYGGVSAGVSLPPPPSRVNPLDRITPVTDALLANPPPGEWLGWRRSQNLHGFSPLKQITKQNVGELRVAWTWTLPSGPVETTPLFHDGVLFTFGYGDKVQALDAATGDLLWQYNRRLPQGASPAVKRSLALYGDKLFTGTSDVHVVALDVRTGKVAWDSPVAPSADGYALTSGITVANGKVIASTTGRAGGGNFIVAFDANTGKEAWRFATIPKENEPGGKSWNGVPHDKRNGASVWLPGTYDPAANLVYFGVSQTYDTAPYIKSVDQQGVNKDLLYTDSTLAINPDTGKLAWHFQHLPNDVWDYDWAFGRLLIDPSGNGKTLVGTGGKLGIFDFLDGATGKYSFSFDLGLQDVVLGIDPRTGAKRVDPRLTPTGATKITTCPHAAGVRNWLPESYNAETRVMFIPAIEACMDLTPVGPDGGGMFSTGLRWSVRPRLDSDGKYGRLEAYNVQTKRPVWTMRQRSPLMSGVLATAGGVVFVGGLDRVFAAHDDASGEKLWQVRLNDIPNSAPITYQLNGKQYVAIAVGGGGPYSASFTGLVPEISNPPDRGAQLWVFELPDRPAVAR